MFARLDVQEFLSCFTDWLSGALSELSGQHVAIDGKVLIAATEKSAGGKVPFILNAYVSGLGISVCQLEIGEKANETAEMPRLPGLIDVEGRAVTIDAIGTQGKIMDLIRERGGHFCLQPRRNHRKAFDAVNLFFSGKVDLLEEGVGEEEAGVSVFEETNHGHGRDEARTYFAAPLGGDARPVLPAGGGQGPGARHGRPGARGRREPAGDQPRRALPRPQQAMGAEEYAGYARGHRGTGNGPRHVLDVTFDEDGWKARAGNARSNLALPGKICLNLVMQARDKGMSANRVPDRFEVRPETFRRFLFESVPMRMAKGGKKA